MVALINRNTITDISQLARFVSVKSYLGNFAYIETNYPIFKMLTSQMLINDFSVSISNLEIIARFAIWLKERLGIESEPVALGPGQT